MEVAYRQNSTDGVNALEFPNYTKEQGLHSTINMVYWKDVCQMAKLLQT